MRKLLTILLLLVTAGLSFARRPSLDLSGIWTTPLGPCALPGSTDQSGLGPGASDTTDTSKLTRLHPFVGRLRYERDVVIPQALAGKPLLLTMERTKPSTLEVDGAIVGHQTHIYAPHKYFLDPLCHGTHHFAIDIDNTLDEVPACLPSGHGYSEHTQTNWNGILGEFRIEALPDPYVDDVQVYPDVAGRKARVVARIVSRDGGAVRLKLRVSSFNTPEKRRIRVPARKMTLTPGVQTVEFDVDMGESPLLWSEFHPALYAVRLKAGKGVACASFGMKDLRVEGNRLVLNGNRIFLRGTHDGLVFPLTGYPPMDRESWMEVFRREKEYGLNHCRFHSCAPPRAAFEAADMMGILMQVELPMWGAVNPSDTATCEFMKREGRMLLDMAGNSPSFMSLGLGNELRGDVSEMRRWVEEFRARDSRHLYDFGANNFLGRRGQLDGEDILITCRTDNPDGSMAMLRSSFSFADEDDGGIINARRPQTCRDFEETVGAARLPIIGHETGQFQSYPDFSQIGKYTGVLHPYNLKEFQRRLDAAGMGDQAVDFARASGAFAMECYKEDIEYFFRTPSMSGFQMLDLKDYPGQGTALVGILDAFLDSKGNVTPEQFRGWCSPVVPLACFNDFCRRTSEPLILELKIANYTESFWAEPLSFEISDGNGWTKDGELAVIVPQGQVTSAGAVLVDLSALTRPTALTLTLSTGGHVNRYHLWAYPDVTPSEEGVIVARKLDADALCALESGGRVLLVPDADSIAGASVGGLFTPDYWNFSMFKGISEVNHRPVSPGTLGILVDPSHPFFGEFPTSFHSDWQWWSVARNSRPLILDGLDGYKPLVQVIDNMERCHRLGILSEFKLGKGSLMVCTCDLGAVEAYPEGAQFKQALLDYLKSEDFHPSYEISAGKLSALLGGKAEEWKESKVEVAADYSAN